MTTEERDDLRERLMQVIGEGNGRFYMSDLARLSDAILERFEVTPKLVISDEQLGRYAKTACEVGQSDSQVGQKLRGYLSECGYEIVRAGS